MVLLLTPDIIAPVALFIILYVNNVKITTKSGSVLDYASLFLSAMLAFQRLEKYYIIIICISIVVVRGGSWW